MPTITTQQQPLIHYFLRQVWQVIDIIKIKIHSLIESNPLDRSSCHSTKYPRICFSRKSRIIPIPVLFGHLLFKLHLRLLIQIPYHTLKYIVFSIELICTIQPIIIESIRPPIRLKQIISYKKPR